MSDSGAGSRRTRAGQVFATPPAGEPPAARRPARIETGEAQTLAEAAVIITGAANGIGRALAEAFGEAQARLVLADIDAAGVEQAAAELRGLGALAEGVALDIADPASGEQLMAIARSLYGRVDVLVNNAGLIHVDRFEQLPFETWRRVLRVNVDGTFLTTQAGARAMLGQELNPKLARRGALVFISSIAAEIGRPMLAAYGASKAAINHLTMTCALAFADQAITSFAIYPAHVREGMWATLGADIARLEGRPRAEVEAERVYQSASELAKIVLDAVALPGIQLNSSVVHWTRDVDEL